MDGLRRRGDAPSARDGSTFPIARAVEVPAGHSLIFHSGMTPAPADAKAENGTAACRGDTKVQTISVFTRTKESLDSLGLGFSDVVAMTVYLVGDPAKGGSMDFDAVAPGMLVEIEVLLARAPAEP